ncbi:hypothetical protein SISSUDRAFT_1007685 [Sistotremastrum suecicum HHB10207 ss-3]|uniref:VWFA domain-containing protein n=1 Tax=Sistotremastrum suecicum HHB10207 ss-3 TaxID=1314776 RepID=A0A166BET6_9AGAM|nr:hypothetical protein SISSUDRAFT_1007685 [Sistotremastrum suecicum HHB10207 ss-3]
MSHSTSPSVPPLDIPTDKLDHGAQTPDAAMDVSPVVDNYPPPETPSTTTTDIPPQSHGEDATNTSMHEFGDDDDLYEPMDDDERDVSPFENIPRGSEFAEPDTIRPRSPSDSYMSIPSSPAMHSIPVAPEPEREGPKLDLADTIRGYQFLQLVSEETSSGIVNKIIIAERHLGRFINSISPGAFTSLTKVDLTLLDNFNIKPVGVYGTRQELVQFLLRIEGIDEEIGAHLLTHRTPENALSLPVLHSGLYLFPSPKPSAGVETDAGEGNQYFLVYWPEENTWSDSAPSHVAKNRITFMRFLTKLCDQILVFIDESTVDSLVTDKTKEYADSDDDIEDEDEDQMEEDDVDNSSGRLYKFNVKKTHEQSETVTPHPGFKFPHPELALPTKNCGDLDPDLLAPRLIMSDTMQGFLTCEYVPPSRKSQSLNRPDITEMLARTILNDHTLEIDSNLAEGDLEVLADQHLKIVAPSLYHAWIERNATFDHETDVQNQAASDNLSRELRKDRSKLELGLEEWLERLIAASSLSELAQLDVHTDRYKALDETTKQVNESHLKSVMNASLEKKFMERARNLESEPFQKKGTYLQWKMRFLIVGYLLHHFPGTNAPPEIRWTEGEKSVMSQAICGSGRLEDSLPTWMTEESKEDTSGWSLVRAIKGVVKVFKGSLAKPGDIIRAAQSEINANPCDDAQFLKYLLDACDRESCLVESVATIREEMTKELRATVTDLIARSVQSFEQSLTEGSKKQRNDEMKIKKTRQRLESRKLFIQAVNDARIGEPRPQLRLQKFEKQKRPYSGSNYGSITGSGDKFSLKGEEEHHAEALLRYQLRLLDMKPDDKHELRQEQGYKYQPSMELKRQMPKFEIPIKHRIHHFQIFENQKCLIIIDDNTESFKCYISAVDGINHALRLAPTRKLQKDRVGNNPVIAVNEAAKLFASVAYDTKTHDCSLHVFRFVENFSSLEPRGSPLPLHSWREERFEIVHACFIAGVEELVLVDSIGSAHIYSLVRQQYRPAFLQRPSVPVGVFSSPDGAAIFFVEVEDKEHSLVAFHTASFGMKSEGFKISVPGDARELEVTSLVQRNVVHALFLSPLNRSLSSISLHITHESSNYQFISQDFKSSLENGSQAAKTIHNSLLDCHGEMWTRFPIISAIQRETLDQEGRIVSSLQFITSCGSIDFAQYFRDMMQKCKKQTKKSFDIRLRRRKIETISPGELHFPLPASTFSLGQWIVELLCLLPIQLAITRENRFLPLKDGVLSSEVESSMLGASLGQIVDTLSIGWYENLFTRYYAKRPVKVVSSMGQQSVGKSYMINHFSDASFQGSAMRTTEGCWLSVTPTKDLLVVSIDFEGLGSVERSIQEDTLLVLFNCALSNLVLFRNNFALGRDIAGAFQSFQSSATVLDPAANPSLFQSSLAIIVKDVAEHDKSEIVKEFQEKFQRIVMEEQESNFMTRLHSGNITIIPWPLIETEQFYAMFNRIRKEFFAHPITHPNGSRFLETLKMLMAKLKINDWSSLDQNLAVVRAQRLESLLMSALAFGLADAENQEELTDMDTGNVIESQGDSNRRLFVHSNSGIAIDPKSVLSELRKQFSSSYHRSEDGWITDLSKFLEDIGEARSRHVQCWLEQNSRRFAGHAEIALVERRMQQELVELKSSLQLCKQQCAHCRLVCLEPVRHSGEHNCDTSHKCEFSCGYSEEHEEDVLCGLPAGHETRHICKASEHLCGQRCEHHDRPGCLGSCTKETDHIDDEHICSARVHQCGMPCDLRDVALAQGSDDLYSCPSRCIHPFDVPHDYHECDETSCPLTCMLCKRLCHLPHFHGLEEDIHLCGQDHSCPRSCGARGACEIETVPHSITSTFSGKLETFQFTKYTQNVKRLPCAIPIPAGTIKHEGPHRHSMADDMFHYCEARCESCDYLCTLPHGHPQNEHETSHGSCTRTQWALEGDEDAMVEVSGHRYAANDSGAPMLCSMVCSALGKRHVHIDLCRAGEDTNCAGDQLKHITERMLPDPNVMKDWITHELYWERSGFKDPYAQRDRTEFALCDAQCRDPEHEATATAAADPSYCTLPMFHPPHTLAQGNPGTGYISTDGHLFTCNNPSVGHQSYHVIFVIDRSGSMGCRDRLPLGGTPATQRIARMSNNRLGAVYSALYSFWTTRHVAHQNSANLGGGGIRRDAYSLVLFDHQAQVIRENDFASTPDELLDYVLPLQYQGGTNFDTALSTALDVMERHWSSERTPVLIFLSDGECSVSDDTINNITRRSIALGAPLSFHAVSFGSDGGSYYLRRMATIAGQVYAQGPRNPLAPQGRDACSYSQAIDTISLATTFLGFAESLQKPRASLLSRR